MRGDACYPHTSYNRSTMAITRSSAKLYDKEWFIGQHISKVYKCIEKRAWHDIIAHLLNPSESLVCAYLHEGSTRRDSTTEFKADHIQQQGCNGSILAWHYLAEIGQKLGYVPKYGA